MIYISFCSRLTDTVHWFHDKLGCVGCWDGYSDVWRMERWRVKRDTCEEQMTGWMFGSTDSSLSQGWHLCW